jgi:hypothetical protein
MEVGQLYQLTLLLVLVGMIVGVGVLVLNKFALATTGTAQATINSAGTAIGAIATTWLSLIVTIAVLAIILVIVIRSFGQQR